MDSSVSSEIEIEDKLLVVEPKDDQVAPKKPMRSYTRGFLLSLSDLEVCKKLPYGFDESLLSEFEESSHGVFDQSRVGSSSLQGFRSDYGSSPPGRIDSGSSSRGLQKWDNRSSWKSDTDIDSESGNRNGSQTRKFGQNSEHDGLLGSGLFPRPSGSAAGAAVPRFRPNSNFPLNKSNEPYHPPRPYKVAPHTRRETNDSFNDETFGSTDSTREDRVEEEKKRRDEFELMRKEQQKALQEKQKSKSGKLDDPFAVIIGVLGNPGDTASYTNELPKHAPQQDDVSKHRVTLSAPPSRPLVPPGFVNNVDKSSTSKSLVHSDQVEVGKSESKESHRDVGSVAKERGLVEPQCDTRGLSEKMLVLQVSNQAQTSDLSDVTRILENGDIAGIDPTITGPNLLGDPGRSTSILGKLFGDATTRDSGGTSNPVEDHSAKADCIWSPSSLQSKFASWFIEEDMNQNIANSDIHTNKKHFEDISPRKPNELISLIVGGSEMSDATALGQMSSPEIPEHFLSSKAVEPKPALLTCEDLEQSILSGIGKNDSNSQHNGRESHVLDAGIDSQASQHLLSLLQRGTESRNVTLFSDSGSHYEPCDREVGDINTTDNIGCNVVEGSIDSGKTLTLEALFGTTFMKELHSAQRSSVGSTRLSFPSAMSEDVNGMSGNDGSNVVLNEDPMLVSGPHDMMKPELPYQNLHQQATSPLRHAQQMNHSKPIFPPLDPHPAQLETHMKLLPMHFQFPANSGQPLHQSGGLPGFDRSVPHILPQMHNAGNLPPSHLERGFSTGAPKSHHPNHNSSGYIHEHNPIQGFPFGGQRQSNVGTPGIAPPGPEMNNPPEVFHRLLEMELRANPKPMLPPFAGGGPSRAMYGHELDMGFRYR